MRLAYADPPYLGMGRKHYAKHHPEAAVWDEIDAHRDLIASLGEYDGWALSCSTPSLSVMLGFAPHARIAAWVKPFASWKPGVNPAYAWEPVLFVPPDRTRLRDVQTIRDWHPAPITMMKGLPGAKPLSFCRWVLDLIDVRPDDEFVDVFPGTDIMATALTELRAGSPPPEVSHKTADLLKAATPTA